MVQQQEDRVYFEAVVTSESGRSMYEPDALLTSENINQFKPPEGRSVRAATALQALGFRVQHIGTYSVSGDAPRGLWEQTFGTRVEERTQPISARHPEAGEVTYLSHMADTPFTLPPDLQGLIDRA